MHLVYAETTLLKIDEQAMLSQFVQNPLYSLDVLSTNVLRVNENVIKVNNAEDI